MNFERILVIAPHPDDDVIAAAGLIQRALSTGGQVHVVFVTDGDNNPWPQRWVQKKWRITAEDRAAWGILRRDEAHCSLARLGVRSNTSTTFLGLPDQKVGQLMRRGDTRLLQALRKMIVEFNPTLIVSPSSRDLHRDHRAIAWCAHVAAGETAITTYIVHGSGNDRRLAVQIELTEAEQRRKRAAIECHESQLVLSRERFLSHVRPTESFYVAEHDIIVLESAARAMLASLRHALNVVFGSYPAIEPSGVQPAADVQERPGDVPGLP